ncbi:hypothetical protein BGZ57DRAFT_945875 [Hyaloscypha finlandica]|nr:hypothetical protein BGZ57DRAFT_945875 [Hyaloscypha finlandica]KAH8748973.1 hypothetical protein F5882DRAFT_85061 [Hyaloscypha sp. PMI_1271]
MLHKSRFGDDPFSASLPETPPSTAVKWANRAARPSRFSGLRLTRLRIGILLLFTGSFVLIHDWIPKLATSRPLHIIDIGNTTIVFQAAFQPPEPGAYRVPDTIDTFQSYKFRNACNVSSLDLHAPFSPLCLDRASMLTAMSSGGRIGHDAPYMPRGCDMRWFTSEEVCEILGRFDKVVLVGDSMLRHMIGSINILIRKDLGYGAVTDWNFSLQERKECFCNEQFDAKSCSVQGIYKTADVLAHDPVSVSCASPINVIMEQIVRFPIPQEELDRLRISVASSSGKVEAIVFGHGLWSNLDLMKSLDWFDAVLQAIKNSNTKRWHGLFVTPNAAGKEKPDDWIVTQGNKALMLFEEAVGIEARRRGVEHLGTWNMSIQSNKYDGVHLDMRGNLVKAMMVMNWLNLIEH